MTTEQRIARLEDVLDDLGKSVESLRRELKADIADLKNDIESEESERGREDSTLDDRITDLEES